MTRELKRVVVYPDEMRSSPGIEDGERVELVHGGGPRDGDVMWEAIAIRTDDDLRLDPVVSAEAKVITGRMRPRQIGAGGRVGLGIKGRYGDAKRLPKCQALTADGYPCRRYGRRQSGLYLLCTQHHNAARRDWGVPVGPDREDGQ
jgi:hypothetical protein